MRIGRFLIIGFFLIVFLIIFGDKGLVDYYALQGKLMSLRQENSRIDDENKTLKKTIILLRSDLKYIELMARKELGMVKEGELVYRFIH